MRVIEPKAKVVVGKVSVKIIGYEHDLEGRPFVADDGLGVSAPVDAVQPTAAKPVLAGTDGGAVALQKK